MLVGLEKQRPGLRRSFADTLAAARPGADQDQSAHQFGAIERHLLRDQATHRVGQQIDRAQTEGVDERLGVARGLLDRVGSGTG